MRIGPIVGLAAAGLALAALAAGSANADDGDEEPVSTLSNKQRMWRKLEFLSELTPTQRYFLMLTAKGEGNYNPKAHNGTDSEREASANAADSNPSIVQRAALCGVPAANLRTGSWTTFQFLAPYVSGNVFEIFGNGAPCSLVDPTRVGSNLNLQIAMAIEHARDLQGYKGFQAYPTVGNLRLGWASPGFMGFISQQAERLVRYRNLATAEMFPPGIVDAQITRFPSNVAAIYAKLQNGPA